MDNVKVCRHGITRSSSALYNIC
ncbi:hypothetical protein NC651_034181 [Populus alba x Populus x berolinensis]|nr:hypothetical protein NC651_034181 [Populus alba x Populus x berolinensis]